MPRRARRLLEHRSYHITHRCHDRKFLLKFIGDRRRYLELLRQMSRSYKVDILAYTVTSNFHTKGTFPLIYLSSSILRIIKPVKQPLFTILMPEFCK